MKYPFVLDMRDFCTDALKARLDANRAAIVAQLASKPEEKQAPQEDAPAAGAPADDDAMDTAADKDKAHETTPPEPLVYHNPHGLYELTAVLTHKGRTADSGHYVSWVHRAGDEWLKYDDDKVSVVNADEIKKLVGGGDWHIAYMALYRTLTAAEAMPHFRKE